MIDALAAGEAVLQLPKGNLCKLKPPNGAAAMGNIKMCIAANLGG